MGLFTATEPAATLACLSCESGLLNDALHASAQYSRDEVILLRLYSFYVHRLRVTNCDCIYTIIGEDVASTRSNCYSWTSGPGPDS